MHKVSLTDLASRVDTVNKVSVSCLPPLNVNTFLVFIFFSIAKLLVLILLIFNFTVTDGTINILLLCVNIAGINSTALFQTFTPVCTFTSLANLDLGIQICFYDGMDDYAKMRLQLAFPFYLIFIAISPIVTSHYSSTIQRLTARRALPVLATLFLLSDAKTLHTASCVLFSYSTITQLTSEH